MMLIRSLMLLILFLSFGLTNAQESAVITADNATDVTVLAVVGSGSPVQMALSPDGTLLAVAASGGMFVHAVDGIEIGAAEALTGSLSGAVASVAFSPDGASLFAVNADGSLRRYDVAAREQTDVWALFEGAASAVAVSPDGALVAAGSASGEIVSFALADSDERTVYEPLDEGERVRWLGFDTAEMRLFGASGGHIGAWTAGTPAPLYTIDDVLGYADVSLHPDGRKLAYLSDPDHLMTVSTADGSERFDVSAPDGQNALYLADGRLMWSDENGHIKIDNLTQRERHSSRNGTGVGEMIALAASADASFVYGMTAQGFIAAWQEEGGGNADSFTRHYSGGLSDMALIGGGETVAIAQIDGSLSLWDPVSGETETVPLPLTVVDAAEDAENTEDAEDAEDAENTEDAEDEASPALRSVSVSPDDSLIAVGYANSVAVFSYPAFEPVVTLPAGDTPLVAFSPDGEMLAVNGENGLVLYPVGDYENPDIKADVPVSAFKTIRWTPNSVTAALASYEEIFLYNRTETEPYFTLTGPDVVYDFAYAPTVPNGNLIAISSGTAVRGFIGLYDFSTETETLLPHGEGDVAALVFSPDGSLVVTVGNNGRVLVFSAADGALIATLPRIHGGRIWTVAFSADGTRLFTASSDGVAAVYAVAVDGEDEGEGEGE